jgi:hypothetical protein
LSRTELELALEEAGRAIDQPLHAKYEVLKNRLYRIDYGHWASGFPHGNDHGFTHIERVLEKLSDIVGTRPLAALGPYELFLTMMAVLYHDIGLMRQRHDHADISALLVSLESNEYLVSARDRDVIQSAVASHSGHKDIETETSGFPEVLLMGAERVRPKVVAALVRLADELDEDSRRADPILQARLGVPEESRFFWEFCRRIGGIQAVPEARVIRVQVEFQSEDIGRLVLLDLGQRAFVAAFADKLEKINRERVYANRFLPEPMRYERLLVTVRPIRGHATWRTPRDFAFDDRSTARDFLAAFPEILLRPVAERVGEMLERIRLGNLTGANGLRAELEPLVPDLPKTLGMKILYDAACIGSLRAEGSADRARGRHLGKALGYLRGWLDLGFGGGWIEKGETPWNEIHRLGNDSDLLCLLSVRRSDILKLLPTEYQSALPTDPPLRGAGGGGGCLATGTPIRTPSGDVAIQGLRIGDSVTSFALTSNLTPTVTTIARAVTSRQTTCLEVDGRTRLTPTQPVLMVGGRWVAAETLKPGMKLITPAGTPKLIKSVRRLIGHFEVYDLEVAGEHHNFVAAGILCHNKRPPDLDEPPRFP